MRAEDADAFSAGARVVGEHDAQLHGVTRIARIALGQAAHAGDGFLLAAGGAVEGFIVSQADVAIGRMVGVKLAIDAHGIVVAALSGEFAGLAQLLGRAAGGGHGFNFGDVGIVGIDAAQARQSCIGLCFVAREFVVTGEAGNGFSVVGRGEKNLLPDLDCEVGAATRFKVTSLERQAGARGVSRGRSRGFLGVNSRDCP